MKSKRLPTDYADIRKCVAKRLEEKKCAHRIPNWTHDYGGAETGTTWQRNMDVYQSIGFNMKAINDVVLDAIDMSAKMFGQAFKLPISAAPMSAAISVTCDDAFVEMAKGCRRVGIGAGVGYPTAGNAHVRMVETGASVFRIIKPLRDMHKLVDELKAGEADGCCAVGIDIDAAAGLKPAGDGGHYEDISMPLSVEKLTHAAESVSIPFIVKGVLSEKDALSAVQAGADAIVVSSHAGYAMDYCRSPLEVLPDIKEVVGGKVKIIIDSGITRGSDIIKAIAMGAEHVFLGRLMIWGLLIGGGEGVEWLVGMLEEEMRRAMLLLGVKNIGELNKDCMVALNTMGKDIVERRGEV